MAKRKTPEHAALEQSQTLEAKYVRRTEDDRWEYGTCIRIGLKTEYHKRGVKATMREAEDAIGMGQPLPKSANNGMGKWEGKRYY